MFGDVQTDGQTDHSLDSSLDIFFCLVQIFLILFGYILHHIYKYQSQILNCIYVTKTDISILFDTLHQVKRKETLDEDT